MFFYLLTSLLTTSEFIKYCSVNANRPVLIELPNVASLHGNEREVIALRSNDGRTWNEQPLAAQEVISSILQSASVPTNGKHLTHLLEAICSPVVETRTLKEAIVNFTDAGFYWGKMAHKVCCI